MGGVWERDYTGCGTWPYVLHSLLFRMNYTILFSITDSLRASLNTHSYSIHEVHKIATYVGTITKAIACINNQSVIYFFCTHTTALLEGIHEHGKVLYSW